MSLDIAAADQILVVVRHGQTDWNLEERFQGQADIPLNEVGYRQAEKLRTRLAGLSFDAAYSSPLRRAVATAQIIAGVIPINVDARLIEIHHGDWQGRTKHQIAERWPDEWERWNNQPHRFTPTGGESADTVRSRVEDFLKTIEGKTILCVSHGVVIQTLLSILLGGRYFDPSNYVPANGSIHTLRFCNRKISDYQIDTMT